MRAVEARQPEVHQDDVRVEALGRRGGLSPVGDRPDDLDPVPSGEEQLERGAVHLVVLHEQHADPASFGRRSSG